MRTSDALRHVIQIFDIAAKRDAVKGSKSSIVTVGANADLTHAVTAGTIAGNGHDSTS